MDYYDQRIYDGVVAKTALHVKAIRKRFAERHKGLYPGHNVLLAQHAIKNLRLQIRLAERLGIEEAISEGYKLA